MIGVIASLSEHSVITEFFELFKTPWEFYRSERRYEVILCCGNTDLPENNGKLVVIYAGEKLPFDVDHEIQIASAQKETRILFHGKVQIPIYGRSVTFRQTPNSDNGVADSCHSAMHFDQQKGRKLARIGYDLFGEIRVLLTAGQPTANASIPALELHIAVLRDLIIASGLPLVEIPAVPAGYRFIACLTHDVDHPAIRRHKLDHTIFGFVYRAVVNSFINSLRGRQPLRSMLRNWLAALKLPLVYLNLAKDFWSDFDRYPELEGGLHSSFFVIPFKDYPGRAAQGFAPARRASRYCASDIVGQIQTLKSAGCEIGLHGIDAWLDSSRGLEELEEVRRITGAKNVGVRMHWLYQNEKSQVTLEEAGADYDSTVGYNETVGYRAGTTQSYKPLGTIRLLELPLHVMDTALFFGGHLDLSPEEARERVQSIIENADRFGGCVTVNWHDRSIAPERLWDDFYARLVDELRARKAWFSTASQVVSWFRKRRSATFESPSTDSRALSVKIPVAGDSELPGLWLRIHRPGEPPQDTVIREIMSERAPDISFSGSLSI